MLLNDVCGMKARANGCGIELLDLSRWFSGRGSTRPLASRNLCIRITLWEIPVLCHIHWFLLYYYTCIAFGLGLSRVSFIVKSSCYYYYHFSICQLSYIRYSQFILSVCLPRCIRNSTNSVIIMLNVFIVCVHACVRAFVRRIWKSKLNWEMKAVWG